jgi:hypothetical protein
MGWDGSAGSRWQHACMAASANTRLLFVFVVVHVPLYTESLQPVLTGVVTTKMVVTTLGGVVTTPLLTTDTRYNPLLTSQIPGSTARDPGWACRAAQDHRRAHHGRLAHGRLAHGRRAHRRLAHGPRSPGRPLHLVTRSPGPPLRRPACPCGMRHAAEAARGRRRATSGALGSRRPLGGGERGGVSSVDDLEAGQVDREEDEDEGHRTRMDRTAAAATTTVAMAAKAADSTTVDSMTMVATTTVAAVAATKDSACGARGTGRTQQLSGAGEHVAGSLGRYHADRQDRRGFHLQIPAARSGW